VTTPSQRFKVQKSLGRVKDQPRPIRAGSSEARLNRAGESGVSGNTGAIQGTQRGIARTNDVETGKARRILGWPG
jgi:hypothetical protein